MSLLSSVRTEDTSLEGSFGEVAGLTQSGQRQHLGLSISIPRTGVLLDPDWWESRPHGPIAGISAYLPQRRPVGKLSIMIPRSDVHLGPNWWDSRPHGPIATNLGPYLPPGRPVGERVKPVDISIRFSRNSVDVAKTSAHAVAGGSFADIWRGKRSSDGFDVALKILRLHVRNHSLIGRVSREVSAWSSLSHRNVLPFLGVSVQTELALVSPWRTKGDVKAYLKIWGHVADRKELVRGIARGLSYLHNKNVVHGDLKASNI